MAQLQHYANGAPGRLSPTKKKRGHPKNRRPLLRDLSDPIPLTEPFAKVKETERWSFKNVVI